MDRYIESFLNKSIVPFKSSVNFTSPSDSLIEKSDFDSPEFKEYEDVISKELEFEDLAFEESGKTEKIEKSTTTTTPESPSTARKVIRYIHDVESWKWEFVTRVTPSPKKRRRTARPRYNRYYRQRSGCSGMFLSSLFFIAFTLVFIY